MGQTTYDSAQALKNRTKTGSASLGFAPDTPQIAYDASDDWENSGALKAFDFADTITAINIDTGNVSTTKKRHPGFYEAKLTVTTEDGGVSGAKLAKKTDISIANVTVGTNLWTIDTGSTTSMLSIFSCTNGLNPIVGQEIMVAVGTNNVRNEYKYIKAIGAATGAGKPYYLDGALGGVPAAASLATHIKCRVETVGGSKFQELSAVETFSFNDENVMAIHFPYVQPTAGKMDTPDPKTGVVASTIELSVNAYASTEDGRQQPVFAKKYQLNAK